MANETVRVITEKENIVAIADAVRSKTGSTDEMTLTEIVSGINGIEVGGGNVETCTLDGIERSLFLDIYLTRVINGVPTYCHYTPYADSTDYTFTDVLCNSIVYAKTGTSNSIDSWSANIQYGDAITSYQHVIVMPSIAGEIVTYTNNSMDPIPPG